MKTIHVNDEVYEHLLNNTAYIGEDASSILERLLGLAGEAREGLPLKDEDDYENHARHSGSKIDECLASPRVLAEREAVGRFLAILSWLYEHHQADFEKILMIEGRKRKYFGKSQQELVESGNSVNPQRIPNSDFWVITNNDTPKKARMLANVLQVLGYGNDDIRKINRSLI